MERKNSLSLAPKMGIKQVKTFYADLEMSQKQKQVYKPSISIRKSSSNNKKLKEPSYFIAKIKNLKNKENNLDRKKSEFTDDHIQSKDLNITKNLTGTGENKNIASPLFQQVFSEKMLSFRDKIDIERERINQRRLKIIAQGSPQPPKGSLLGIRFSKTIERLRNRIFNEIDQSRKEIGRGDQNLLQMSKIKGGSGLDALNRVVLRNTNKQKAKNKSREILRNSDREASSSNIRLSKGRRSSQQGILSSRSKEQMIKMYIDQNFFNQK